MMCGVQQLCISLLGAQFTKMAANRHWNHHRWHATDSSEL